MVRRWDLVMVEKEMVCASLCVGSMRDLVFMRGIYAGSDVYTKLSCPPSRGCPWWLYICSQLGFTSNLCLLLQVEVLGFVGFVYPSSGLLPWQEPGRQISRTEGSYPRQPVKALYGQKVRSIKTTSYVKKNHPSKKHASVLRKIHLESQSNSISCSMEHQRFCSIKKNFDS
jgi:hypothetical protein